MAEDNKYNKIQNSSLQGNAESESGESGKSGSSGQVEFRDFTLPVGRLRDDQMPPDVKKHLLLVHEEIHKARVEKQKEKRKERHLVKEGKISVQDYRQGKGHGGEVPQHPILADKAQFSGIDDKVKPLPNDAADTNNDKREELQYQYNLRYTPEGPVPSFNPRPQHG